MTRWNRVLLALFVWVPVIALGLRMTWYGIVATLYAESGHISLSEKLETFAYLYGGLATVVAGSLLTVREFVGFKGPTRNT